MISYKPLVLHNPNPATPVMQLNGAVGQSSFYIQALSSTGAAIFSVDAAGSLVTGGSMTVGSVQATSLTTAGAVTAAQYKTTNWTMSQDTSGNLCFDYA